MSAIEKLRHNEAEMNRLLIGRKEEVRGIYLATLARQHAILFGPHGEAKSMLLDMFVEGIEGAVVFSKTVAQDTLPDDLFVAAYDFIVEDLGDGKQRNLTEPITTGMMPEAHIVNLREIFRCSGPTLNALLTAINERYYEIRGQRKPMPLISVFGDTNNLPGEDLEAFYDRFMLRYVVDRIAEKSERIRMRQLSHRRRQGDDEARAKMQPITLDDLSAIQGEVLKVKVNERMDDLIEAVIERLYEEGVIVYGRRDVRLNPVLQANAHLEGRDEVNEADLVDVLPHTLWDNPDHRKLVRKVVLEIANPIGLKVQELLDDALEIRNEAMSRKKPDGGEKTDQEFNRGGSEANAKLKKLISGDSQAGTDGITQLFEQAKKSGFPTKQIQDALEAVQRYQKDVAQEVMGFDF
jgi:MoxR-like ATPase